MKRWITGYLYILPAFVLLGLFSYWPLGWAFKLSLYKSNGIGLNQFVGLSNFVQILVDPVFWKSFVVLAMFMCLGIPLQTFGPLLGAKLLHSLTSARSAYVYRVLFVLPLVVPMMVGILVWRELYGDTGAINRLLELIGLEQWTTTWLGNPRTVIGALVFMGVPWVGGINLLIYLAGFLNISNSLYEASQLEGARPLQIFTKIELPLLRPQIRLIVILAVIGTIQMYENILVLTNGGPADATLVPALYLFKNGFEYGRLGYASAVGFILFLLTLGLTLINMHALRAKECES